jgi:penicillin-binding protein 1C
MKGKVSIVGRVFSVFIEFRILIVTILFAFILFWNILPNSLFDDPISTVVYDRDGELLGARIAADGQWRFPGIDSVPAKYQSALLLYEDKYFFYHPGVNLASLFRALRQNLKAGDIVSGGSTITMQVMRMSRKNRARTITQKLIESSLALRYEMSASKQQILLDYTNNAPFGGNVVGIEAAAWRYFGTAPSNMTWSEATLLAVLPNAPSLIHPGKNRGLLKQKRDLLLQNLFEAGEIDEITYSLAKEEPLPAKPLSLPDMTPHLTDKVMLQKKEKRFYSTIDNRLQERVIELTQIRHGILKENQIHNMACLVMKIETGEVVAYVGNSQQEAGEAHGNSVDIITSERSTGSILKPLLFAGMLDNGSLLQTSIVPDVPIRYDGYAPKNYNREYEGAVPAAKVLERSLNIPSVILLRRYGVDPFLNLLKNVGFTTFKESYEHYGLTLILGGAETSLWELGGVYGSMARVLNHYNLADGTYSTDDYHMPVLNINKKPKNKLNIHEEGVLSAGSIYTTFKSLLEVNRPEELSHWQLMSSTRNIAWKTGTSYGFRDAWSVGVTPEYLVAVWAGNADGEGRPGLSGVVSAAPLMFDVFSLLPETSWFEQPLDDLAEAVVCRQSGYLAAQHCKDRDTILAVPRGLKSKPCPFHTLVHLDEAGKKRVNSACYPVEKMQTESWFILPPLMEWYYKKRNPSYRELPPVKEGCADESVEAFEIVYPEWDSHVLIPVELDGSLGKMVMEVAHREDNARVYWHLDEAFIGSTDQLHQLAVNIDPGMHILTVVDMSGNRKQVKFEVLGRPGD